MCSWTFDLSKWVCEETLPPDLEILCVTCNGPKLDMRDRWMNQWRRFIILLNREGHRLLVSMLNNCRIYSTINPCALAFYSCGRERWLLDSRVSAFSHCLRAPCGLRGCKNGPAPFPGWMSYKATKPGLVSVLYLSMFFIVLLFIRAPFYVLLVFIVCVLVVLVKLSLLGKLLARKTPLSSWVISLTVFGASVTNLNEPPRALATSTIMWVRS